MFQKRSLTTGFLVASLGIAAGLAVLTSPDLAGAADCSAAVTDAKVKAHCTKGGKDGVKKAMKTAVDTYNDKEKGAAGFKKLECKTCHKDLTAFELNADGEKLYKDTISKYLP